MISPTVF